MLLWHFYYDYSFWGLFNECNKLSSFRTLIKWQSLTNGLAIKGLLSNEIGVARVQLSTLKIRLLNLKDHGSLWSKPKLTSTKWEGIDPLTQTWIIGLVFMYSGLRKDLLGVVGYNYLLKIGERKGGEIFVFLLKGWFGVSPAVQKWILCPLRL